MSLLCHETLSYSEEDTVSESLMDEVDFELYERVKKSLVFYKRILSHYKKHLGADLFLFIYAHNQFIDNINYRLPVEYLSELYLHDRDFAMCYDDRIYDERELIHKINKCLCFYRTILQFYQRDTDADISDFIYAHNELLTPLQNHISNKRIQDLVLTIDRINTVPNTIKI